MKKINLLLISALILWGSAAAQDITKTFAGVTKIRLTASSGDVHVKPGSGSEVKVKVSYSYRDDEFRPVMEQHGTTLMLKEDFSRGNHSGRSDWTLEIPENIDLGVSSGSGNLEAEGIALSLRTNVGSGNVDLANTRGDVRLNTGSGNVRIQSFAGNLDTNTGSGDIEISASEGEIKLNAGSGDMKLTGIKAALSANVGSGSIRASGISITDDAFFNSGSGNVRVQLASDLDHSISVNSGSGHATLDFGGTRIEGTIVMTANKRGGKIVAPFTFDDNEEMVDGGRNVRIRKTARIGEKDIQVKVGTGSGTAEISR